MSTTETPLVQGRRETIANAAITAFAREGYFSTTVADVATEAGFSSAYVFRLFTDKLGLFLAALERCFDRIEATFSAAAREAGGGDPLDAMGEAYARLIANRSLLMLQVHAQSASDIPEIRMAMQGGYQRIVDLALHVAPERPQEIQHFLARGMLCHLMVTLHVEDSDEAWVSTAFAGLRHPASE